MKLTPGLEKVYTKDSMTALDAQRQAEFIAFGPMVFQISRIMIKYGILEMLKDSKDGLTAEELVAKTGLSPYAIKILTEGSLSIGTIYVNPETDRFKITKTGWFLLTDDFARINVDFNHDVNYEGMFKLEESLKEGRPAGLEHFGSWKTIYEALSQLPEQVQRSWFGFDHFYSDNSFDEALEIVFSYPVRTLLDVGGNTGKWARRCVSYNPDVEVTVADLPQQIGLMKDIVKGHEGEDRIFSYGINVLDPEEKFPEDRHFDVIWMSQFLDCFSENEICSILKKTKAAMGKDSRLFIMETFWNRQKFETAALILTMTSAYFTALANGNSKMYCSEDMEKVVAEAGLEVEKIYDGIGFGHSIMVCKLKQ